MQTDELLALMAEFRIAYAKADRSGLQAVTSPDFEWHQHYASNTDDLPNGRLLIGVDALLEEIAWRREHWRDVRYTNLEERATADLLVQTFVIQGLQDDRPFHAKAVDLYPVQKGLILRKDTYWKQLVQDD